MSIATITIGSILIICWTLFRFYTKTVNFDQTGQQLLARQWLDGFTNGSIVGPTNYIIKMIFLYMPADMTGINPAVFLVISTIILNIITFIGIYFLLKKILEYFAVPVSTIFNLLILWLSTIAGSVFWIQFSNSRNIEIVAGLGIIYLGLLIYRKFNLKLATGLVVLSGITFFADPMQLFISSVVLLIYITVDGLFFAKNSRCNVVKIFALIAIGYVISIIIKYLIVKITNVQLLNTGSLNQSLLVFLQPGIALEETAKNFVRIVAGTNEMGSWRQVLNIGLVIFLAISYACLIIKKKLNKKCVLFSMIFLIVPLVVYVASGQPLFKTDTSRYLIMIIPALIITMSTLEIYKENYRKIIVISILLVVVINSISLVYATLQSRRPDLVGEQVFKNRYEYIISNNYSYGYSSMDTAIPSMYLFGNNKNVLLPLVCDGNHLRKSNLFYDKSVFDKYEQKSTNEVPIILDSNSISNYPSVCSGDSIKKQLGNPISSDKTKNGDEVLIYQSDVFKNISF